MPDLLTPPLARLLPHIEALPRVDKFFLFRHLAQELDEESPDILIADNQTVEIWSPYDSLDAEAALLQLLEESRKTE